MSKKLLEERFEEMVQAYADKIYSLCYYMTEDPEAARDLTQETFLRAWKGLKKFRGESSVYTWLYKIALNRCRTYLKKRSKERKVYIEELREAGWEPSVDPPHDPPEAVSVRAALRELPPDYREVLLLYYWEEMSYEEIAEALGVPMGTVKSRLHRAKEALRRVLNEG